MGIKVRQMQKQDLQQLSEIYTIVYQKFDVGERWTPESSKELLSYWFDKQPDLALVAEFDEKIVGAFVAGVKPWWDGNHLVDGEIFVHPDYQKKGIGTELSKAIYKIALEKYKVVRFDTYTFKKTNFPLSWYKSQGFTENKEWAMIEGDVKSILSNLEKE